MPHETSIDAAALFDDVHQRVEVAGQVFVAGEPAPGVEVVVETAWGSGCRTRCSTLGSFGAWFRATSRVVGDEVSVEAAGSLTKLRVR
jgi:hypothetical protein